MPPFYNILAQYSTPLSHHEIYASIRYAVDVLTISKSKVVVSSAIKILLKCAQSSEEAAIEFVSLNFAEVLKNSREIWYYYYYYYYYYFYYYYDY